MQKLKNFAVALALSLSVLSLLLVVALTAAFLTARTHPPTETVATSDGGAESDAENELLTSLDRRVGVLNFLICGTDRASGLCDVIILAQLDREAHTASLVQIPRDTYAAYTDRDYRKLNGAPSALGGIGAFREFLEGALAIPIDHYLLIDLDCVGDVVDAVGGVTLDIPIDMDYEDASQNLSIHLKAGVQTLDGDTAEQYLRYRAGYVTADLGRLDAQKRFVSAFLEAVQAHTTLPDLIRIVRTLYGRVTTDVSLGDAVRIAATAVKLKPESLTMETLPGEATRTGVDSGAWYYVISRAGALDTVNRLLNVSDTPIPSSAFDPNRLFTSAAYPHFEAIYRRETDE